MRVWVALLLGLAAAFARAQRIILIPLDSRPAAGQFAQMIGSIASIQVIQPPYETLGRFTSAGSPDAILAWLAKQDFKDVDAVVVSTDMIAYGGLIASRTPDTTLDEALHRLRVLDQIRKSVPKIPFYGFSAIMRLAPTATRATKAWRAKLTMYEEIKDRYRRSGAKSLWESLVAIRARIPDDQVARYEATRKRDEEVQENLIHLTAQGLFDYLILGQDDAQPFGPHVPETAHLKQVVSNLAIDSKVYFCEGIDQHSNILVSRALLRKAGWVPRIRIVYSDDDGRLKVANFESKDIEQSLRDQIFASGARPALDEDYDYTLYLNTPGRREDRFQTFLASLNGDADKGLPVCVADIDLAKDGTADPELFQSLVQNGRMVKLLSYAGWNTAGNTMGTAIPAANVYLYARKYGTDALQMELARREFLLHRFVNDYDYHKFTRPVAYRLIDATSGNREETYGQDFAVLNNFVHRDLGQRLEDTFKEEFLGTKFKAGDKEYQISGMDDVKIFLPWPRAYEVRLEFKLQAKQVPEAH